MKKEPVAATKTWGRQSARTKKEEVENFKETGKGTQKKSGWLLRGQSGTVFAFIGREKKKGRMLHDE